MQRRPDLEVAGGESWLHDCPFHPLHSGDMMLTGLGLASIFVLVLMPFAAVGCVRLIENKERSGPADLWGGSLDVSLSLLWSSWSHGPTFAFLPRSDDLNVALIPAIHPSFALVVGAATFV